MNTLIYTTLLTLTLSVAAPPKLVRVAIVDNSPSMSGERIAAVRTELTNVIRQLPPSDEYPLVLIVFHAQVEPTQVFTDPRAAEKAVAALSGQGTGTYIAPALSKAHDELLKLGNMSNVLVMLYTDGEDDDQQGIHQAEAQLDVLFNKRSQQGLSQSVFVKRWGNANAELISRLRANGHVQVLDAGELSVEALMITPVVDVIEAKRDPQKPQRLQVTYSPSVALKGKKLPTAFPACRFVCLNSGAQGQTQTLVQPDSKKTSCTLTVPLPDPNTTKQLSLTFQVTPTATTSLERIFFLPILPTSTLTVQVSVPPMAVKNRLEAKVSEARVLKWQDPDALLVRCQVELAVTATAVEATDNIDRATTFEIAPQPGVKLVGDTPILKMPKPGTFPVEIMVDVPVVQTGPGKPARTGPIDLTIQPVRKPDYLSYEPKSVCVHQVGLTFPEQVQTNITPIVKKIGRPVWVDLAESLATFDADVMFRVEGSIPQNTTLSLLAPGNIRGKLIPPGTILHSGETVVTLKVIARLTPGKPERLDFSIVAPPATPAVRFNVERGFSLSVVAPPPASIVCLERSRVQTVFPVKVADNQYSTDVTLRPALTGVDPQSSPRLPKVAIKTNGATLISDENSAPFFQPRVLKIKLPELSLASFFFDSQQRVDVELKPNVATPAVLPGHVQIIITRQAPLKRLLMYLAWAVFPIGILALLAKIIHRLREPVLP